MRLEDAPPAGWYPDPEGGSRLRWWEGTDWADRWRAPPTSGRYVEHEAEHRLRTGQVVEQFPEAARGARRETDDVVAQVRQVARSEVDRAIDMFGKQARAAQQNITPLITEYTSLLVRWLRRLAVLAVVLLIIWLAFQIFAQASLFDWIGNRIDNLTDNLGDEDGLGP